MICYIESLEIVILVEDSFVWGFGVINYW